LLFYIPPQNPIWNKQLPHLPYSKRYQPEVSFKACSKSTVLSSNPISHEWF
jgi:hypothetical protein